MKRYFLPALLLLMAATAVPAQAKTLGASRLEAKTTVRTSTQVSSPSEISEDATFHDLIRHNRRVRDKN